MTSQEHFTKAEEYAEMVAAGTMVSQATGIKPTANLVATWTAYIQAGELHMKLAQAASFYNTPPYNPANG